MAELEVELTPDHWDWVGKRLAQGRYVDAAEYLRDLVRKDMPEPPRADTLGDSPSGGM